MAARKTTKPAAKAVEEVKTESVTAPKEEKVVETPVKAETVAQEKPAEKKAPARKETAKKAPAKKAAAKTEAAVKEPAAKEEEKAPGRKPARKAECVSTMHIQFAGKSYTKEDLVKIAKDVWKYDLKKKVGDFKAVELYVKPEESVVYYVINGEEKGQFNI